MTLERGTLLHNRYRVVEIMGQGGMGSVYRAVDENLGVDIALKENLFTTDEYARQFRLEAVILANLRHPNLPRVSDHFGEGEQGQYLVMDFIEGEDLRQRMERVGVIAEKEVIMIGAAMCDALGYLHTRKPPILHRDLKPGNVKIAPEGQIFLVDFGLAKVVQGAQATTTGARAMTPGYSPPEQYGTARTDVRTDIYSLGATLYAALTATIPEDGLARAMDNAELTPVRKRNSKVSRRLASAIETSMAIDPKDRYQNAEDFKKALLGSKSATRRLAGNYLISTLPSDEDSAEGSSLPKKPKQMAAEPEHEFIPPKKKKKRKTGCILPLFWILLFLVGGTGAVSYYYPPLVPASVAGFIPWIDKTQTPTPIPQLTVSFTPILTPVPEAVMTHTLAPTIFPTEGLSATPSITLTPAPTPLGGGQGQIAFASARTGIPQIYLVDALGDNVHPITNQPDGACQPSWSPDGAKLVFTSPCKLRSDSYRNSSLYTINIDGGELTPLTTVSGGDFDPAWSPDGSRIVFTSLRDGHSEIYSINLDDSQLVRLTDTELDEENYQPFWSPFGNQIVYVKKRVGALQIWTMTDTGQNSVQMVRSGQLLRDFFPVWSPDGEYILFSQQRVNIPSLPWIMQIRYEDRNTQNASRFRLGVSGIENLSYSSDGFWMVYEGVDESENKDIFYITASGDNRTRVTTDPSDDFDPAWRPIENSP